MTRSSRSTLLLKFGSKSALEEDEEPEPKVRTATVSKSTDELGLTEDASRRWRTLTGPSSDQT